MGPPCVCKGSGVAACAATRLGRLAAALRWLAVATPAPAPANATASMHISPPPAPATATLPPPTDVTVPVQNLQAEDVFLRCGTCAETWLGGGPALRHLPPQLCLRPAAILGCCPKGTCMRAHHLARRPLLCTPEEGARPLRLPCPARPRCSPAHVFPNPPPSPAPLLCHPQLGASEYNIRHGVRDDKLCRPARGIPAGGCRPLYAGFLRARAAAGLRACCLPTPLLTALACPLPSRLRLPAHALPSVLCLAGGLW